MPNFFSKLIRNNTGVSSKNFFLVCATLTGILLLAMPILILSVEVINNHTISTDLNGLAAYIAAVAGIFASAGFTKAWSENAENKKDKIQDETKQK